MSRHLLEESERLLERTGDALSHSMQSMKRHPARTGGLFMLILAAIGVYWMWPEVKRYMKIERM